MANSIGFLFQPASGDISINLLTQIFGNMGIATSGGSLTLLGSMFSYFNSVILAVAALIIVYMTVMGVIHTAHEGEFMGKKWNSPFTIIRIVIGVAGLVPTPLGYSLIQILMMWVIMQGVGAADALWTGALNTIQSLGSPYNQLSANVTPIGINGQLQQLFQMVTCDQTARSSYSSPSNVKNGGYYCSGKNPPYWCGNPQINITATPTTSAPTYYFGANGGCGSLQLCSPKVECAGNKGTSTACATCLAQYQVMNTILQNFINAGQTFATVDYQYQYFFANSSTQQAMNASTPAWVTSYCNANNIPANKCCVAGNTGLSKSSLPNPGDCQASTSGGLPSTYDEGSPQNPSSNAVQNIYKPYSPLKDFFQATANTTGDIIQDNANLYKTAMTNAVASTVTTPSTTSNPGANTNYADKGWIVAGAYYHQLAQKSSSKDTENTNVNLVLPTLTISQFDPKSVMNKYRNNYNGAGFLIGTGASSAAEATVNDGSKTIMNAFTGMPNIYNGASNDPILGLMIAGTTILGVLQITLVILIALWLGLSIGASILPYVLGTGIGNPLEVPALTASILLAPFLFGAVVYLISIGGLLSIYVPMIPYIIFSLGAIGWMVGVIETIVAAPLVALGIIIPAGDHELLGQAKPALMMLFNVFLRPCLMLFGLFTAMLLARVAIQFINYTFWGPVWQYYGQFIAGGLLLGFFMMLAAYVMLVISVLNKCFSLIYHLPDTVLSWIGGQGSPGGRETGEGALKEAKSGVEGVGSQASSGLKGAVKDQQKARNDAAKGTQVSAGNNNAGANNNAPQGPNQNNNNNNNNNPQN